MSNELYTFVAENSLKESPFTLACNCGGKIFIYPPIQERNVICPECEAIINIIVLEGDPGYVIGLDSSGKPTLLPVQGSLAKPVEFLTNEEKDNILKKIVY